MTRPPRAPGIEPWVPPEWHVTVTDPWQPAPRERAVEPRADAVTAVVTALFAALLGPVAGLVWAALAPQLAIARAINGDEAAFKAQIGADAWFLGIGLVAGAVTAAVAIWVFRRRGPGLLIGLALGGVAAAFIAARVGFLVHQGSAVTALHAAGFKHPTPLGISLLDFRVRALGVVMAWPFAAVALLGIVEMIDAQRR